MLFSGGEKSFFEKSFRKKSGRHEKAGRSTAFHGVCGSKGALYIVVFSLLEKIFKKMKKSVDIPGFPWYYIQALERDGKKRKAG
ncbi:MAG: hypothetical protein U0M22_09350, partial [Acutalibacteraceae bacterium]|nr:hypothetical protein [Acutalibacteraceae bacterium]